MKLSYKIYDENRNEIVDAIRHYEKVLNNEEPANRQNCPLCRKYNNDSHDAENACQGCPVFDATGEQFCTGTPYADLFNHHRGLHIGDGDIMNRCKRCEELIHDELKFLRSLHPFEVGNEVKILRPWTITENHAYKTGLLASISETGIIDHISVLGNCRINNGWYPPVVLALIDTDKTVKPKAQIGYRRIIHRGEKRILITGFYNILIRDDLPFAYADVSPYFYKTSDERIYSSRYGYIDTNTKYTIKDFDDLLAYLRECSTRLHSINEQQATENAGWECEGIIEI